MHEKGRESSNLGYKKALLHKEHNKSYLLKAPTEQIPFGDFCVVGGYSKQMVLLASGIEQRSHVFCFFLKAENRRAATGVLMSVAN